MRVGLVGRRLGRRLRPTRCQHLSTSATPTFAVPAVDESLMNSVRETAAHFIKRHCEQHVAEWETERLFPRELYSIAGQDGLLRIGYPDPHGVPGTDAHADPRYFMAVQDEISKLGSGGISAGLFSSNSELKRGESRGKGCRKEGEETHAPLSAKQSLSRPS